MGKCHAVFVVLAVVGGLLVSCEQLDLYALARSVPPLNGKTWSGYTTLFGSEAGTTYSNAVSSPCVIKDSDKYKLLEISDLLVEEEYALSGRYYQALVTLKEWNDQKNGPPNMDRIETLMRLIFELRKCERR